MTRLSAATLSLLASAGIASAQGRPMDWASYGGDAQRTGWEKSDSRITKDNIKDFQLVLKHKLGAGPAASNALTPPVLIGMLISYRGFKELAFVTNGSGDVWAIDADLDRIFWQKRFGAAAGKAKRGSAACSGAPIAIPALTPPMNFAAGRPRPGTPPRPPAAVNPDAPPKSMRVGGTGFGTPRSVFMLTGDGMLHQLNSSDGSDQFPPLKFVPASARASSLTLQDGIIYTTTSAGCGGAPDAVWAMDLNDANPQPVSYALTTGAPGGIGGFALGQDGTVYVQTSSGKEAGALLALSPKDLKLKQSFTIPGSGSVTPVVFPWKGKELVLAAGKQGSLYLLDGQELGGADHKTPLYQTAPLASANDGIWGGLSTWEDTDGTRWVLAPVWGPFSSEMKAFASNGPAPTGSIVAFKVEDHDGKPTLAPGWVSRDMTAPEPPVITGGSVFVVSSGGAPRKPSASSHATLYALDAATGKEIYSTGDQVTARANLTGMTLANGRIYFTTADGTLYAFGVYLER